MYSRTDYTFPVLLFKRINVDSIKLRLCSGNTYIQDTDDSLWTLESWDLRIIRTL